MRNVMTTMRQKPATFIACVLVGALAASASAVATSAPDVAASQQTTTPVSTHAVRGLVEVRHDHRARAQPAQQEVE